MYLLTKKNQIKKNYTKDLSFSNNQNDLSYMVTKANTTFNLQSQHKRISSNIKKKSGTKSVKKNLQNQDNKKSVYRSKKKILSSNNILIQNKKTEKNLHTAAASEINGTNQNIFFNNIYTFPNGKPSTHLKKRTHDFMLTIEKNNLLKIQNDTPITIIINQLLSDKQIENLPQYNLEYIPEIYENLLQEEKNQLKSTYGYMNFQSEINEQMRAILIDWIIDVHLKFHFTEETLYSTINIIDIYLSLVQIQRANLQLLGVSALYIACKEEEISFPHVNEYVYITDNAYTKEQILAMEFHILKVLQFNILSPSPLRFYEILSLSLGFNQEQFYFGKYLMESFIIDYRINKYSSSLVSCACSYMVMKLFNKENYQICYDHRVFNVKEGETKDGVALVKECAKDICYCVDLLSKGKLEATRKKYSTETYLNVASRMSFSK